MKLPFELESLSQAVNYQRWVADFVRPYIGERTLEVGSGIGNMSKWIPVRERLVLSEVEPQLLDELRKRLPGYFGPELPKVSVSSLDLSRDSTAPLISENLDTIISFNVLEHVEDDAAAVTKLLDILRASDRPQRRLVSFVPAQSWAFSPLDKFYGHFRRYSLKHIRSLSARVAPDAKLHVVPFNAIGLAGWVWSTLILRDLTLDARKVKAFDAICPYTKHVDNFACHKLGWPLGQSYLWVLTLA